jgi:hypothetical protein
MKTKWFKPFGWVHIPNSIPGVICSLFALLFCAQVFVAVDRHSHSVSDTLYGIYPFVICTFLAWDWLARRTS